MERRQYENPPLLEAVCEFRFSPDEEWDNTIAGRLFTELEDEFPEKQSGQHVDVDLNINVEEEILQPSFRARKRTIFQNDDETYVVQLLPNLLTVHRLRPYPSWPEFRPVVLEVFRRYLDVADPDRLHRANVRYLNHIEFSDAVSMGDNFDFYPHLGDDLPDEHGAFLCGVEFPKRDDELLRLEMTSVNPHEEESDIAVRLDLTYGRMTPTDLQDFDPEGWLDAAHDDIEEAFEGAIREPLREKFGVREVA